MSLTTSQREALERWERARKGGPESAAAQADLYGFFQAFRPHGNGLDGVFATIPAGDELLQRLLDVYRVTAPGWEPSDAYFLVKRPRPLANDVVFSLARQHRDSMAQLASHIGAGDLRLFLDEAQGVSLASKPSDVAAGVNLQIYEAAVDFMTSLPVKETDAALLEEAYYSIACDYFLKYYLLWPLYRESSPVREPFHAYSELWKHGIQCDFATRGTITLSAPRSA